MTLPSVESKPRYSLTYERHSDPRFCVRFDTLSAAAEHFRHVTDAGELASPFGRIYDRVTNHRGKMFPSGRVRWNDPKPTP